MPFDESIQSVVETQWAHCPPCCLKRWFLPSAMNAQINRAEVLPWDQLKMIAPHNC